MDEQDKLPCFGKNRRYTNGCSVLDDSLCLNGKHYENCSFYKDKVTFKADAAKARKINAKNKRDKLRQRRKKQCKLSLAEKYSSQ